MTLAFSCDNGDPSCSNTQSQIQFGVSMLGLIPLGLMLRSLNRDRNRDAAIWLAVSIVTYAAWAVLNDAAVHEWHDLTLL